MRLDVVYIPVDSAYHRAERSTQLRTKALEPWDPTVLNHSDTRLEGTCCDKSTKDLSYCLPSVLNITGLR